jgi:hypothetical protein
LNVAPFAVGWEEFAPLALHENKIDVVRRYVRRCVLVRSALDAESA